MQTQSLSRADMLGESPAPEDAPTVESKNQQLRSKIARLTTIYSSGGAPSTRKSQPAQIHKRIPAEILIDDDSPVLPPEIRSLISGESYPGNMSTRTTNGQRLKGVIPASMRLGKTFIQHQLLSPQHSAVPGIIGRGPANRNSLSRAEEETKHSVAGFKVISKTRRIGESCSRSTAANSTLKQDSGSATKGITAFAERKAKSAAGICKDKRLASVVEKVRVIVGEYRRREEILIKENQELKEKVISLRHALSAYKQHK